MNIIMARRGATLIEAAIILGIAGLVVGAVWVAAGAVNESNRTNQALKQITLIAEQIRTRTTSRGINTGLADADVTRAFCRLRAFPPETIFDCEAAPPDIRHPWDGQYVVGAGADAQQFTLSLNDLTPPVCGRLVNALLGLRNWETIEIGTGGAEPAATAGFNNVTCPDNVTDITLTYSTSSNFSR